VIGSQLISNVVRRFFLAMVLTGLLTGSVGQAASYQKRGGTIVDPILNKSGIAHYYSGPNFEPYANLANANVSNADLTSANLHSANLTGADLSNAHLTDATLSRADLSGANLISADLALATLTDANLDRAYLAYADLTDANLTDANLTGAHLYNARLTSADLTDANLSNADLRHADLTSADLTDANLSNADLLLADLSDAILSGADLRYADLRYADLSNANLRHADLTSADLTDANLSNADLTHADLYSVDLTWVYKIDTTRGSPYYYGNTVLPAGFDAVAQGWTLAPYCDFTPDAVCDLADINQMFQAGNLVTGVITSGDTDRLDLFENDTIDAADITEWLTWAATANGHGSPYLRGDTEFDRDVDITDFNTLAANFGSRGAWPFWNEGNFNGDDNVDITDFNLLAANFAPSGYATSTIPEPSTMLLASLALILVGVSFRLSKNG